MTIADRLAQKGKAAMLIHQLQHKFGSIPTQYRHQLESADASHLLKWGKQVLEAASLEELFGV